MSYSEKDDRIEEMGLDGVFFIFRLSFNSYYICLHEALPLTRFGSSLAVIAFSAVLPSFW